MGNGKGRRGGVEGKTEGKGGVVVRFQSRFNSVSTYIRRNTSFAAV